MPAQHGAGGNNEAVEVGTADAAQDLVVSGAGRGVDPAHLESSSSGFGLPSIRRRFEFIGGRLNVDSAPTRGSPFTLIVPP